MCKNSNESHTQMKSALGSARNGNVSRSRLDCHNFFYYLACRQIPRASILRRSCHFSGGSNQRIVACRAGISSDCKQENLVKPLGLRVACTQTQIGNSVGRKNEPRSCEALVLTSFLCVTALALAAPPSASQDRRSRFGQA